MNFINLIKTRKSIRDFTGEFPPREIIRECLEAASWAPNPTTQQPWKFIVLTGESLKTVCKTIEENFSAAQAKLAQHPPPDFTGPAADELKGRKERTFGEMMKFLKEKRVDLQMIGKGNFVFHNAPMGIIFATYPCKDQNYLKATICAMENFLLAATAHGLGTCWMNAVSICQEHIKQVLALPDELILVDGVAVGYPVKDSPLNQLPRSRLPVEAVTEFK